jgi:uncharacterized membrane protein YgcG
MCRERIAAPGDDDVCARPYGNRYYRDRGRFISKDLLVLASARRAVREARHHLCRFSYYFTYLLFPVVDCCALIGSDGGGGGGGGGGGDCGGGVISVREP